MGTFRAPSPGRAPGGGQSPTSSPFLLTVCLPETPAVSHAYGLGAPRETEAAQSSPCSLLSPAQLRGRDEPHEVILQESLQHFPQ